LYTDFVEKYLSLKGPWNSNQPLINLSDNDKAKYTNFFNDDEAKTWSGKQFYMLSSIKIKILDNYMYYDDGSSFFNWLTKRPEPECPLQTPFDFTMVK
jgi:hypothetical protein